MALGARDLVVQSHVFALCPRAEQRREQGGPHRQPAREPLRLEVASELTQRIVGCSERCRGRGTPGWGRPLEVFQERAVCLPSRISGALWESSL